SNRSDRNFKTAAYDYDTEDEWDATVTTASAEAGLNVAYGGFSLRPSASMSWLSLSEDAHAEDSGLVGFDLAYDALDVDVTRAKAGLALAFTKGDPHGSFTQELRLGWSELIDTTDSQVSGLFVDGSVPFLLDTTPLARTELSAGFGLSVLTEGAMAGISYDATMGDGELSHGAKLQISVNF
ncbi:MAG: autotransporter outer membrane beta-barrel domain-containing protein, partial [Alphaproteobacteria bacterium]|nr:autotransporter outer membrane beta-barrel domain-containing protein [Alphaproteobacteria bacterium]